VAGLVAITPASGYVLPGSSIIIGLAAGVICFWSATSLKHMLGYDDSLDAFGVHGVGGIIGALLTGVFAYAPLSATDATPDGTAGGFDQLKLQAIGVLSTIVYSGVMTFFLLMVTKLLVGLRVGQEEEREGLDIVLHGEQVF
jgi:Amt family ammonium transporter